jgi:CzcA family heavy metal efflux pump
MLQTISRWSITQRWLVVALTIALTIVSLYTIHRMPLDVLPNFSPPQVEVQTEAPGLAPEAIEKQVTFPLESAIKGTPGVDVVRSSSAVGVSVLRVTFKWGTDPYQARQRIAERLTDAQKSLSAGVGTPEISPLTPPIGTVAQYAFTADQTSLMDLRSLIDSKVSNRLLSVPGVAQVLVYGGEIQQFQVIADPKKLTSAKVSLDAVSHAVKDANATISGGLLISPDTELVVHGEGNAQSITDIENAIIRGSSMGSRNLNSKDNNNNNNVAGVQVKDVATVKIGAALQRGDASWNGQRAVIVMVNKQPLVDSPTVTEAVSKAIEALKPSFPKDVKVNMTFRQDQYIKASVDNVRSALIEGSVIVALILIPFLMNWRTLTVCLLDFALTLLFSLLVCALLGLELNTMTLGGLAVAIGTAVDDAIVYGENTYRRLRENHSSDDPKNVFEVIFQGSQEVRESLIGATLIGILVFAPIFTLSGIEGRIFTPMGIAYLVVVVVSSLESLFISPALCAIFLPHRNINIHESRLSRFCKFCYQIVLKFAMQQSKLVLGLATIGTITTIVILPNLGRNFLPTFQEKSLMNAIALYPGSSLEMTNRIGIAMQNEIKKDPRFESVQLRAGRVPGDPDAASVNLAHLDVELSDLAMNDRPAALKSLREILGRYPGVASNVGGFISHRMDEVLSGVRSALAIKVFGPDLVELRRLGEAIEKTIKDVPGLVDLQVEPQIPIRQVKIKFNRDAIAQNGLTAAQVSEFTELALNGRIVSQIPIDQRLVDLMVTVNETARQNLDGIRSLPIETATGKTIALSQVATVDYSTGPNTINREDISRLIVVSANIANRDISSVVADIKAKVQQKVPLPKDYSIQYGGQYESQQAAAQNFLVFSLGSMLGIGLLMYLTVKSVPAALMILVNLPLSLVGGVVAVLLTGGVLSVSSMVGFVTLFGVATRNGLLLVDNYNQKFAQGWGLKDTIIQGSTERLLAILMTALTSALGLLPLILGGSTAGKELLQPLSIVVIGGLITSTALTLIVLPALYIRFGTVIQASKRSA